ncbi:unnamed protein product [Psylliodes chrysocephalus]|uniref:Uncharacterized protein n=1 Tax=Psylliodes chrysocephalus TaxID=3402493 RepID=A0A9P0GFX8_9CUCU|nr:unnamed protein product [Psylliodes chrysocephala]
MGHFIFIYTTYIRPKIEFAQTVWDPYFVKDIELLERVQRRVTKIPPTLKNNEYCDRLAKLQLTSLKDRRTRGDLIETYKWTSGYYTCDNIIQASTSRTLRDHSKKLDIKKSVINCKEKIS